MTVKLRLIRPYFSYRNYVLLNNHQYNCNITKSFLSVYVLKEMIDIKEGRGSCDVFNIDDALHIINDMNQIVKIVYHFCTT